MEVEGRLLSGLSGLLRSLLRGRLLRHLLGGLGRRLRSSLTSSLASSLLSVELLPRCIALLAELSLGETVVIVELLTVSDKGREEGLLLLPQGGEGVGERGRRGGGLRGGLRGVLAHCFFSFLGFVVVWFTG